MFAVGPVQGIDQRGAAHDPGVVHQNFQPAKGLENPVHGLLNLSRVRHVARHGEDVRVFLMQPLQALTVNIQGRDPDS